MTASNLIFVVEIFIGMPLVIAWGFFARRRRYSEGTFWIGAITGTMSLVAMGVASKLLE